MMKKSVGFVSGLLASLLAVTPAFAQTSNVNVCPEDGFKPLCTLNFNNIGPLIGKIIIILLIVAVVVAVFFLIWGGIKWILSGGDKQGVESARNHIIAAIVGLIIALLAFFLVSFVLGLFNISLTNLEIPKLVQN